MEKPTQITLAFRCPFHEVVVNTSTGLHCQKCSSDIVDFTNQSIIEQRADAYKAGESICGVFKKSQLSDHFLKYAAATLIVTSSITLVSFGQEKTKVLPDPKDSIETHEQGIFFGTFVEVGPEPVGGFSKFFEALAKKLKYPSGLTSTGKCFVELTIDTMGVTKDYKILRGVAPHVDQEVLRALQTLNYPWKPARIRNKAITSRYVVPILFDNLR